MDLGFLYWRREFDGVASGETGIAEIAIIVPHALPQALHAQVPKGVRSDVPVYLLDGVGGGNELRFRGGIDPEETGVRNGGRTDSNVNPFGSSLSDHLHDLSARSSPHDGIVDYRDALSLNDLLYRGQLDLDAEMPDGLLRFDERPSHIVVPDEA